MYKVNVPYSSFSCKGVEIPAHRWITGSWLLSLTVITSLQGNSLIFCSSYSAAPVSNVFHYISYWAFIGHKDKEQQSPLPDGGATIHAEDERDSWQPSRPYESNCSWGSFLPQVEIIWEPQSITQTWPGHSAATTWVTCGTPGSIRAPSPPEKLIELELGYTVHREGPLGWCPGLETKRGLHRLLQRGGRRERNNALDKIHRQRLTTNSYMLAATINMTREDKMKNSKWRNQRTCQRL